MPVVRNVRLQPDPRRYFSTAMMEPRPSAPPTRQHAQRRIAIGISSTPMVQDANENGSGLFLADKGHDALDHRRDGHVGGVDEFGVGGQRQR